MDVVFKAEVGFLPETPPDAVRNRVRDTVVIGGRTFVLSRPAESDRLLDHAAVQSAFAADEFMPYWADLWPSARMLAKAILRERGSPAMTRSKSAAGSAYPALPPFRAVSA